MKLQAGRFLMIRTDQILQLRSSAFLKLLHRILHDNILARKCFCPAR